MFSGSCCHVVIAGIYGMNFRHLPELVADGYLSKTFDVVCGWGL